MKMTTTWPREPCGVGESLILWTVIGLGANRSTWPTGESSKYGNVFPSFGGLRRDSLALDCSLLKEEVGVGNVCSGGNDGSRDDGRDESEAVSAMRTRPLPVFVVQGLLVVTV